MFCPPEMEHTIRGIRGDLPIFLNTSFHSIDHVPIIAPLLDQFDAQMAKDDDAWKHVPDLYKVRSTRGSSPPVSRSDAQIWTAKPWFVHETITNVQRDGRGVSGQAVPYEYVFWIDAGSMRQTHAFGDWPSLERVNRVWRDAERLSGTPRDDLVFIPMEHAPDVSFVRWTEEDGPIRSTDDFSEGPHRRFATPPLLTRFAGSLFGGTPRAMEWWYRAYLAYFYHYLATDHFVGNDQLLMNALFILYPDRFITAWNRDPESAFDSGLSSWYGGLGYCGGASPLPARAPPADAPRADPWFSYEFFLASDTERAKMNDMWTSEKLRWDFWRQRPRCRPERILPMKDVLVRTFGPNWRPPVPALPLPP